MTDFLLITGPIRDLTFPPMALAQLKSISESAGFACRTIDYNQKYFSEQCNKNKEICLATHCQYHMRTLYQATADNG